MRLLDCDMQPHQPYFEGEDDPCKAKHTSVEFDVDYFRKCLAKDRDTSYKIIERPDIQDRQSPQPDYLLRDCTTGSLVAVEHTLFLKVRKLGGVKQLR